MPVCPAAHVMDDRYADPPVPKLGMSTYPGVSPPALASLLGGADLETGEKHQAGSAFVAWTATHVREGSTGRGDRFRCSLLRSDAELETECLRLAA